MSVLGRVLGAGVVSADEGDTRLHHRFVEARSRVKRALLERVGFDEAARMALGDDPSAARRELAPAAVAVCNGGEAGDLQGIDVDALVAAVLDDVVGLGPIQGLLEDDSVSEVMVNGGGICYFEREGTLHAFGSPFDDEEQIRVIVDRIISPLGRRVDERSPIVNARLPNGYRVNAVIPPIALDGTALTIRKFSDRITDLGQLVEIGSLPRWYAGLLSCAVKLREDLAVAGGTGSGKTTLLNALSCEIPLGERIVTIEDSAELKFGRHPHVVRLEAREASIEGEGAVSIRDLVTNSLRMRPDRIVVGEVRGAECIDMLQAMVTGHDGSLTTLHAGSAEEAVVRLALLARLGIDLPGDLIKEQIAMALDGIVMSLRRADGRRFVGSYCSVSRAEGGGVRLEEHVSFDPATASWSLVNEPPFIQRGLDEGALDEEEVEEWRCSCP